MNFPGAQKLSQNTHSISARFRNTNIALFILASIVIVSVMIVVLQNITDTVSRDYARLYSTNTSGALSTHLNKEIALVRKAALSDDVVNWFADEENYEKKIAAHTEMLEIIDGLFSDNMYLGINSSLNEYTVEKNFAVDDIKPHARLDKSYFDDAWYFECIASPNDYILNVDIDKILHRKRVWINHKVMRDGVPLGVICTGMEFAQTAASLLAEYDNTKVRGVIIDDKGIIQMDSKSLGDSNFLHYDQVSRIEHEFSDPVFLNALKAHLSSINGFFQSYDTSVIELSDSLYSYATIAPIENTNWSVITFYNSSSLFNMTKLIPLFISMIAVFIIFTAITSAMSYRLLFKPVELLMSSLAQVGGNKAQRIYGVDRRDEIGDLSQTIQDMKDRLDSYNTDLENEVEARSADLKLAYEQASKQHQIILSSIDYASKIQRNMLPSDSAFGKAFADYAVIWKPKDIVGGDIYWIKNFDGGTVLCVCDCTGHGTPGALLTMLVVSAFETLVNESNYQDTAQIIWELEKRLVTTLNVEPLEQNASERKKTKRSATIHDGCDLAVLYVARDGAVNISTANMHVFICDGKEVTKLKGQKIHVGDGTLKSKDDIRTVFIPPNPESKFYIASDGLYDQIGGENAVPFGYAAFKKIILENHDARQSVISEQIWQAFEAYRGDNFRRDDIELITFKPNEAPQKRHMLQ